MNSAAVPPPPPAAGLPLTELRELERLRRSSVVVYCAAEQSTKPLSESDVIIFYRCLRRLPQRKRLDLVLHTEGGALSSACRIAHLLHDNTRRLAIMVPHKAHSAGTLLCLAAHELVLGPLGELSPLDPIIRAKDPTADAPGGISSEDIRAFVALGRDWFGQRSEAAGTQALALLSQRIFPTTLSAFYRADRYVRLIAQELLRHHLPRAGTATRARIVDRLISAYPEHTHSLTRTQLRAIGVAATAASVQEEALLWGIYEGCRRNFNAPSTDAAGAVQQVRAVLFSGDFAARYVTRRMMPVSEKGMPPRAEVGAWEVFNPSVAQ